MEPDASFYNAFTPEVKSEIIELLDVVAEFASDNFAAVPDFSTGMTFGVDMYQFATQAFLKAAQKEDARFSARFEGNTFRCRAGQWDFGIYRVGRRANDSIWESFPNSGNKAGEVGAAYLPGMEPEGDRTRGAIIAYMCNPQGGLGAVYLCIPRSDSKGKIIAWAHAELLWREDEDPNPQATVRDDVPPVEDLDDIAVRRRARGESSAG